MWFENSLIFKPVPATRIWNPPPDPAIVDAEFRCHDGTRLHGWYLDRGQENGALLFAHGVHGNVSIRSRSVQRFASALGRAVLIFDYPGYGKSEGKPSERSCYASAEAAYRWLTEVRGIPRERIILYGESLGGGIAVELATRVPHHALMLMKTFTSLPDAIRLRHPWFPSRALFRTRFDNIRKIGSCPRPVLIAAGTADRITPLAHAQKLLDAATAPKRLVTLDGSDHNAFVPESFLDEARRFLDEHPPTH